MSRERNRKEKVNPRLEFLKGADTITRQDCPPAPKINACCTVIVNPAPLIMKPRGNDLIA